MASSDSQTPKQPNRQTRRVYVWFCTIMSFVLIHLHPEASAVVYGGFATVGAMALLYIGASVADFITIGRFFARGGQSNGGDR